MALKVWPWNLFAVLAKEGLAREVQPVDAEEQLCNGNKRRQQMCMLHMIITI